MITEILLAAIANTTTATQYGLDIRDPTRISNIIFLYPYCLLYP
jgi:hypothetical protein